MNFVYIKVRHVYSFKESTSVTTTFLKKSNRTLAPYLSSHPSIQASDDAQLPKATRNTPVIEQVELIMHYGRMFLSTWELPKWWEWLGVFCYGNEVTFGKHLMRQAPSHNHHLQRGKRSWRLNQTPMANDARSHAYIMRPP